MAYMFFAANFNQDVSSWDTSKVTNFEGTFGYGAFNNGGQPLSSTAGHWSTASLTNMGQMFVGNTKFNQPVTNWDTSKLTGGYLAFFGASAFNQDLSSWNFSAFNDGRGFLGGVKLSTANYDALLNSLATQTLRPNIGFDAGSSIRSSASAAAYQKLTAAVADSGSNWTFTDGGTAKSAPTVLSWPTASKITVGQSVSNSTLTGGSASVPGTFAFETPASTPAVGSQQVSVIFTPTDSANYSTVTSQITITVDKINPIVAFPTAVITYGQALIDAIFSGQSATVAGIFSFLDPSAILGAGTTSLAALFTPTDGANYSTVSGNISIQVNKATPTIVTNPVAGQITAIDALSNASLSGGVASVAGTFAFTSPTSVPGAGTTQVSVTFTPTDATNYNTVVFDVPITITQAGQTLSWAQFCL
jgi:surface protein